MTQILFEMFHLITLHYFCNIYHLSCIGFISEINYVFELYFRSSNLYGSSWKKFLQTARSRLTVAQVIQGVEAGAMLTFDFLILLVISVLVRHYNRI